MNIAQIENNLKLLFNSFDEQSFIYELLLAYGQPRASIKRLQIHVYVMLVLVD
jgi:hypothetical protein